MALFTRDANVYVSTVGTGHTTENTHRLVIKEGSLNFDKKLTTELIQNVKLGDYNRTNLVNITKEAEITLRFTTYFKYSPTYTPQEKFLWESLFNTTTPANTQPYDVDISSLMTGTPSPLTIYLKVTDEFSIKLENCYATDATVSLDIDDYLTIDWEIIALSYSFASAPAQYTDFIGDTSFTVNKFFTTSLTQGVNTYNIKHTSAKINYSNQYELINRNILGAISNPSYLYYKIFTVTIDLEYYFSKSMNSMLDTIENSYSNLQFTNGNIVLDYQNCLVYVKARAKMSGIAKQEITAQVSGVRTKPTTNASSTLVETLPIMCAPSDVYSIGNF